MNGSSNRIPAPEFVDIPGRRKLPRRGADASIENDLPIPALPNQSYPKRTLPKRSIASVGEVPREASMPPVVNPPCIKGKGSKRPLTATASSGNLPGENSYQPSSKRKTTSKNVSSRPGVKLNGLVAVSPTARTPVKKNANPLSNGFIGRTPPSPTKRKTPTTPKKNTSVVNGPMNRFLVSSAQKTAKNSKNCSQKNGPAVTKAAASTASPKIKSPKSSPVIKSGPKVVRPVKNHRNAVDNAKSAKTVRRSSFPLKKAVTPKATPTKAKPKCSKPVKPNTLKTTQPVVVEDPSPSPVIDSPLPEPEIPAETASMGAVTEELPTPTPTPPQDEKIKLKCPPFCSLGCTDKHSPLLIAVLNCDDNIENFEESDSLKALVKVLDHYRRYKNWKKNGAISDVNPEYRYPVIHWAAILSKINVVKWMASNGYNINTLHSSTGDTALHRVLLCVRDVKINNPVSLEKFSDLLEILQPNLHIKNKCNLTPFLTIVDCVSQDLRSHKRHVNLLQTILNFAKEKQGLLNSLLKQVTATGDTAVHLLAQKDKYLMPLKMLVEAGADVLTQNKLGMTPLSIAMELGEIRLSQFLDEHIISLNPPCPDTPSSTASSSRETSSNSPMEMESVAENIPAPVETEMVHNTVASPTSPPASETDASSPPLSKRIKTEGNLPSDYESDVSENTIRFALSRDSNANVKHIIRHRAPPSTDNILKQYFHICNDRARENLVASINVDKQQCLDELKVTEEQIATISRRIDAIWNEKQRKEMEVRQIMLELKAFDQTLDSLRKEKQELTDKSSTLDAKVSLCLSVLQIVHDKNT